MPEDTLEQTDLRCARLELSIPIEAPRDVVWEKLTQDIGTWWHPDFYMSGEGAKIEMELQPGGRVFERTPDGGGLLWFTIVEIQPGQCLQLVGRLCQPYGGPANTDLRLTLEDNGSDQTTLRISDHLVGVISDSLLTNARAGWKQLFEDGFKRSVES